MHVCACILDFMETIDTHTRSKMLADFSKAYDARFFKTLSEPVRIRILQFLMENGRSDIGSITGHMPQDRSVISRHLSQMHSVGILTCEKETRHMYYSINGQAFVDKLELFLNRIKKCMAVCCPSGKDG